jgi:hypothetical protein
LRAAGGGRIFINWTNEMTFTQNDFKVYTARFILPFFVIFAVVTPRKSYAFVPAASLLPVITTVAGGTIAISAGVILLGVAAIGAIAYLTLSDANNANSKVRIPMGTGSTNVVPSPASGLPTTVAATSNQLVWSIGGTLISAIAGGAAGNSPEGYAAYATPFYCINGWSCQGAMTVTYTGTNVATIWTPYETKSGFSDVPVAIYTSASAVTGYTCPIGYTLSATTCTLNNAYYTTINPPVDFSRTGNSFAQPTGSPIAAGNLKPVISTTTTANDTITVSGNDSHNNPQLIKITNTSTGGLMQTVTQKTDNAGNTYLDTMTLATDLNGNVVAQSNSTNSGNMTTSPTTGVNTPTTTTASNYTPQTSPSTSTTSSPTDYARQGEAATAATTVVTELQAEQTAMSASKPTTMQTDLSTSLASRDAVPADIATASTTTPWTLFTPFQPFTATTCTPFSLTYTNHWLPSQNIVIDPCSVIGNVQSVAAFVVYVVSGYSLWAMFTGRTEQEA